MRVTTIYLLLLVLLSSGCSFLNKPKPKEKSETDNYTEQDFYDAAQKDIKLGDWEKAIKNLEGLEAKYPFGDYAEQAQLELIYARHRSGEYEAAIAAADRFIRLHPQHPNVDYAYYLKGLSSYVQTKGFFDQILPTDDTKRDPGSARGSFTTFSELLNRFPESAYAPDARKRMVHLRNVLARHEIHVANYYFLRGAYLAAANRGRYAVENFQKSPAVPDGLAVMAQAYHFMQMDDLAADAEQLLASNFPDHPSLDESGKFRYVTDPNYRPATWLNRLTLGLYDHPDAPSYDTRYVYNERFKKHADEQHSQRRRWLRWLTLGILK